MELLGRLMPKASMAQAMVLAVYMPPQEPGPGIAQLSISLSSWSEIFWAACLPTASKTETMSNVLAFIAAGQDRAAIDKHRRTV